MSSASGESAKWKNQEKKARALDNKLLDVKIKDMEDEISY
jgi:hypothetical protein